MSTFAGKFSAVSDERLRVNQGASPNVDLTIDFAIVVCNSSNTSRTLRNSEA
jgi:hypothetical protein